MKRFHRRGDARILLAWSWAESGMSRPRASKEIGHEEFDPIGTLALIGLYFLILVMLWLFTYFVEFVGNEPTPMLLV